MGVSQRNWAGEPSYDKPDISVRSTTLYYQIMAPVIFPYLSGRLLNLFRCREGKCFFQRNRDHPPTAGEFDSLVQLESVIQKNGRTEKYFYLTTAEEVIACAKAQSVEFHGWGSSVETLEMPDRIVIDLDPDPNLPFETVKDAAVQIHQSFDGIGLKSYAMLTGGKGIHIVVPLMPSAKWNAIRLFAKTFCTALAETSPDKFTVALPKRNRIGKIFLDFLRNQRTATAIMPYSARARSGMPVATPVGWDELKAIKRSDEFTVADVEKLLKRAKRLELKNWGIASQLLPKIA